MTNNGNFCTGTSQKLLGSRGGWERWRNAAPAAAGDMGVLLVCFIQPRRLVAAVFVIISTKPNTFVRSTVVSVCATRGSAPMPVVRVDAPEGTGDGGLLMVAVAALSQSAAQPRQVAVEVRSLSVPVVEPAVSDTAACGLTTRWSKIRRLPRGQSNTALRCASSPRPRVTVCCM
jgi:hypothetical protein